ncbi:rab-like protein 6 isoform X2 [Daktulosphaira vitifoliae]|uniref:rab-like protein 6 isoform X2 n=1 Tax=Daktulosphaira vitifoliae TaxID=58002 RepID=UPI0021AA9DD3|nr:rab-like protein 6 isoform X2 [Daktulosphaira vitifoliae]
MLLFNLQATPKFYLKIYNEIFQKAFNTTVVKIVIKGDRNVGKTCLWNRLQGKPFIANYEETDEIQVAHIKWNYKNTEDVVKVEVWDVVDKGKKRSMSSKPSDILKTEHTKTMVSPIQVENTPALDAELVDVYRYTNGVLLVLDITKRWTLDYVYNELPKIPDNIPILVLGNHCDMNHHRSINSDEIVYYLNSLQRGSFVRYAEASMSNGFGLKLIYKWIGISFLQLQRENIINHLETNERETKIMTMELDVYQQSNEANYDMFISRLSNQRRTDAENKSVTPTLPLPLLNAPSPNTNNKKSSKVNQKQFLDDFKTQNICKKIFPLNKLDDLQSVIKVNIEDTKEDSVINNRKQHNDSNNLDDFVPDDVLDKSFLDDTSHGDIVIKGNKEIDLDSDSDDNSGNPMVTCYQADIDPDDILPGISDIKIDKNISKYDTLKDSEKWSSIQNTMRPRPEGGEDKLTSSNDCYNSLNTENQSKEKKIKLKGEKRKKKRESLKSDSDNLEQFLRDVS